MDFVNEHSTDGLIIRKKKLVVEIASAARTAEVNTAQAKEIFNDLKDFVKEVEEQK